MSAASQLLRLSPPAQVGLVDLPQWQIIERDRGELPGDYKDLISTFGYGSFGDLILLHPAARRSRINLEHGEKEALEILAAERSDTLDAFLRSQPRILAVGPERRYWAHDGRNWFSIAWDVEEVDPIGEDLCEFLGSAFESLSGSEPQLLAKAIWKTSSDGSRDAFFHPARNLE